ncbi:helix-turn-helix domain-containing protein [Nocardia abscessus]|uniref:helix-turn-helix domain-containing protein n=1 Tax=Nocardia abscessus TaxID=120957 RepID=UPI003A5CDBCA
MPPQWCERSTRPARLSFAEREEIACRRAAGESVRAIARSIGRSASTVSRELARGTRRPKTGCRFRFRVRSLVLRRGWASRGR